MPRLVLLAMAANDSPESLPLGAACVAASVRKHFGDAVDICLLDEALPLPDPGTERSEGSGPVPGALGRVIDRVLALDPDWLGLSIYTWNRVAMVALAKACAIARPHLLIFAGGPEAGADSEGLLAEAPIHFVVRGEGESVTVAALAAISAPGAQEYEAAKTALSRIAGIATRDAVRGRQDSAGGSERDRGAVAVSSSRRAPAENLACLPSPWLSGFAKPKESGVLWELARGCPYRCSYCYEGKGERGTRRFPMERVEAELDLFVRSGVRQAFVLDPTFDADRVGAKRLLGLIADKAPGIHWKFEIRAELVDSDLAHRFAALSSSLQVGLQTADPAVSAACGRPLDLKAFARGLHRLNEAGCVFGIDLIYGLPGDSLAGFVRSLDYALGFQPNHLDLFPLAVLPGTELSEHAVELGLVTQSHAPHLVLSTPTFPAADLARAKSIADACDLFYSQGRAVSWFLQVARPLGGKPHAFLERFAAFVAAKGSAPTGSQIEVSQLEFIELEYGRKKLLALLPAARDLVRFNAAWGRALADGESSTIELAYDPDEVLGPGALDLHAFVRGARARPGTWTVKPGAAGPVLEKLVSGKSALRKRRP